MSTIFVLITESFYNLNFVNNTLINSRKNLSISSVITKPSFFTLVCALSLIPSPTLLQKELFLCLLSALSLIQLLYATQMRVYYNHRVEWNYKILLTLRTSGLIALAFAAGFEFTLGQYLLEGLIIFLFTTGLMYLMINKKEHSMYVTLCNNGMQNLENQKDVEHILCLALEYLENPEPRTHCKFLGILTVNEKKVIDENTSFFNAINKVIQQHESYLHYSNRYEDEALNYEKMESLPNQEEVNPENNEDTLDMQDSGKSPLGNQQHLQVFSAKNTGMEKSHSMRSSNAKDPSSKNVTKNQSLLQANAQKSTYSSTIQGAVAAELITQMNQQLDDIFQDTTVRRNLVLGQKSSSIVKINGVDIDVSNLKDALKTIKLRFFYEVLIKQALQLYPESVFLMLLKAQISLDRFQNKYLTLTTVTHLNNLQSKLSYKENLQCQINVNYFIKAITLNSVSQNQSRSLFSQNNSSELDSTDLLDQTLRIDQIINTVKICSMKITQFWQLAGHESMTVSQINRLQTVSLEISEMLRQIRQYVKQLESMDSFESQCETLIHYLSYFFIIVVRDRYAGQQIIKQMSNQLRNASNLGEAKSLGQEAQSKSKLVDQVGVVVVDGNFNLYGKILFVNKIVVKALSYQDGEVQGKLIHSLMPSKVAEVHNIFWNSFATIGVPKVLDQMRHLYVKDANGYVTPFKIFIRFQFSPKFGYSFVGLFLKPQTVTFDYQQIVSLQKTFHFLCNDKGKILEMSQSVNKLLKLTPKILDQLHAVLAENFNLSLFNKVELNLQKIDFSRQSCILFKQIELNLQELKTASCSLEIVDENDEHIANPFLLLPDSITVTLKIIKETYGNSNSTLVSLYYVVFTKQIFDSNHVQSTSVLGNSAGIPLKGNSIALADSESDAQLHYQQQSVSREDSVMNTGSVSSASSSISQSKNQDIKYVEEGIDYQKTPRPLIYLQLSTVFLFLSLLVLATSQYSLNQRYEAQNLRYQKVLIKTATSQQLISHLTLMTRCYQNIQLGLEPNQTAFFPEGRTGLIRKLALDYIDEVKGYIEELHDFFLKDSYQGEISDNIVSMYSIFSDDRLQLTLQSRLNALSTWLVNIFQVFVIADFKSQVGTYRERTVLQQQGSSNWDQVLFYVLVNGQNEMLESFKDLNDVAEALIIEQVTYSVQMNKYYVSITSVLVVSLTIGSLYLITVVLKFKARVLTFFSEIPSTTMTFNEQCARDFYEYITTDDTVLLKDSLKRIDQYQKIRQQILNGEQLRSPIAMEEENRIDSSKAKASIKIEQVSDSDEEEEKGEMVELELNMKSSYAKANSGDHKGKKKQKEKKKVSGIQSHTDDRGFTQQPALSKNKEIEMRLQEIMNKKITNIIIAGIIAAIFFTAYFVAQYLIFSTNELQLQNNSSLLRNLVESIECTDSFILNVRTLQTSNISKYDLNGVGKHVNFIPSNQQSNSLNATYQSCINKNQAVNQWLQTQSLSNTSLCSIPGVAFNTTSCETIFQGILKQTPLQQTSVFLQEQMQAAITFLAPQIQKSESFIRSQLNNSKSIQLLDAHILFKEPSLKLFYDTIIDKVVSSQSQKALTIMYIIFASILVAGFFLIVCFIIQRIKLSFWHAFYILRLVPTEDVDRDFIKRINDYLSKA